MADFDDFERNDNVAPDKSDPVEDETNFINNSERVIGSTTGAAGIAVTSLQQELLQTAVNDNYNALARTGKLPS